MRPGGIKGVQSLQNLTSYAKEEMTRVVSERTVCYCSNFDLDAAEWYRQYATLKNFPQILHKKLGKCSQVPFSVKILKELVLCCQCCTVWTFSLREKTLFTAPEKISGIFDAF